MHKHHCWRCRVTWVHGANRHNSYPHHQCPKCGRLCWKKYLGKRPARYDDPNYLTGQRELVR